MLIAGDDVTVIVVESHVPGYLVLSLVIEVTLAVLAVLLFVSERRAAVRQGRASRRAYLAVTALVFTGGVSGAALGLPSLLDALSS